MTDQNGEVIQYGTLMDQEHFNNMECGISDQGPALALVQFKQTQDSFDYEDELLAVNLGMNALPWPFNNKETTVALKTMQFSRRNRDLADEIRRTMTYMYHLAVELEKKYYRKTTTQELDVELEWLAAPLDTDGSGQGVLRAKVCASAVYTSV